MVEQRAFNLKVVGSSPTGLIGLPPEATRRTGTSPGFLGQPAGYIKNMEAKAAP